MKTQPKVCPKTGRQIGPEHKRRWARWSFPLLGVLLAGWFAIRVFPRPGRMAYPCQQLAATTVAGYLAALAAGFLGALRYARRLLTLAARHGKALGGFVALAGTVAVLSSLAISSCEPGEEPDGIDRKAALRAGPTAEFEADPYADKTVVRIYDPSVTSFKVGTTSIDYYWRTFDKAKLRGMLETALLQITGASSATAAWKMILPELSGTTKIAVKANMNDVGFYPNDWYRSAVTDPAMMVALVKSLTAAGASEQNITIFDYSRDMPNLVKTEVHADCPGVVLKGKDMTASSYKINLDGGKVATMPQDVMDATYLIDLFLFKHHSGALSGALKNLGGLETRADRILHGPEYSSSQSLATLITNAEIKKRFRLAIGEAIFGCQDPTEYLDKSVLNKTDFFPGKLASSLFVSRSPFMIDTVMLGFMNVEKKNDPNSDDGETRWLSNCVGKAPNWVSGAIHSARVVDGAKDMPPKDLGFDTAAIEFISMPNGGGSAPPPPSDAGTGTGGSVTGVGGAITGSGGAAALGGSSGAGGTVAGNGGASASLGGASGKGGTSGTGGIQGGTGGTGTVVSSATGGTMSNGTGGSGGTTSGNKGGQAGSASVKGGNAGSSKTSSQGASGGCQLARHGARAGGGELLVILGLVFGVVFRGRYARQRRSLIAESTVLH